MQNEKSKADALWGNIVHMRDGRDCYLCEPSQHVEAHHLFLRSQTSHPDIRFDTDCGVCLCVKCHDLSEEYPTLFWALLERRMSAENPARWAKLNALHSKALPIFRGQYDWPAILAALTAEKNELEMTSWMDDPHPLPERGQT